MINPENPSNETKLDDSITPKIENVCSSEQKTLSPPNDRIDHTKTRRLMKSQDVRYSIDHEKQEKLLEKYNQYQYSSVNTCHLRFLIDQNQKEILLDIKQENQSTLERIKNIYDVNVFPGYQNATKHSFRIIGTEANVRLSLIEIIKRIFDLSSIWEKHVADQRTGNVANSLKPNNVDDGQEKQISDDLTKSLSDSNQSQLSTIEENDRVKNQENQNAHETQEKSASSIDQKESYSFTILITSQGQEVLKKQWILFVESLQKRFHVTISHPLKLMKFGDKRWQNELHITGEHVENIADAAIQLNCFINDALGVVPSIYKSIGEIQLKNDQNTNARSKTQANPDQMHARRHDHFKDNRHSVSNQLASSSEQLNHQDRLVVNRNRSGNYEQVLMIRSTCVPRIIGSRGSTIRRIQNKCHLRDFIVGRQPNENGYIECKISANQQRQLTFAIDTIRSYLRDQDEEAIQVLESKLIDVSTKIGTNSNSSHPTDSTSNDANQTNGQESSTVFPNHRYQQQKQTPLAYGPTEKKLTQRASGFSKNSLQFNNGIQMTQPSYNFQNPPSFDFTRRPTSTSRKTEKRPGEGTEQPGNSNGQCRHSTDSSSHNGVVSSSSTTLSASPRHKSKRTCPETKEIDCGTDDGFWIQKQYYNALDDSSKELFDSLLEKLERFRIANEEKVVKKQQRFVGRNRLNKNRPLTNGGISNGSSHLTNGHSKSNGVNSDDAQEEESKVESSKDVDHESHQTVDSSERS